MVISIETTTILTSLINVLKKIFRIGMTLDESNDTMYDISSLWYPLGLTGCLQSILIENHHVHHSGGNPTLSLYTSVLCTINLLPRNIKQSLHNGPCELSIV